MSMFSFTLLMWRGRLDWAPSLPHLPISWRSSLSHRDGDPAAPVQTVTEGQGSPPPPHLTSDLFPGLSHLGSHWRSWDGQDFEHREVVCSAFEMAGVSTDCSLLLTPPETVERIGRSWLHTQLSSSWLWGPPDRKWSSVSWSWAGRWPGRSSSQGGEQLPPLQARCGTW